MLLTSTTLSALALVAQAAPAVTTPAGTAIRNEALGQRTPQTVTKRRPAPRRVVRPEPKARAASEAAPQPKKKSEPDLWIATKGKIVTEEERTASRKRAACHASDGNWFIQIRGVSMSASGSDVDEIYGHIVARAYNGGNPAPGVVNLWRSERSVNLDGSSIRNFGTQTIGMKGIESGVLHIPSPEHNHVNLNFYLRDEDDARDRGAGNDEVFRVLPTTKGRAGPWDVIVRTRAPSCDEAPEFSRTQRLPVMLQSNGNNFITFIYEVRWFRVFPDQ